MHFLQRWISGRELDFCLCAPISLLLESVTASCSQHYSIFAFFKWKVHGKRQYMWMIYYGLEKVTLGINYYFFFFKFLSMHHLSSFSYCSDNHLRIWFWKPFKENLFQRENAFISAYLHTNLKFKTSDFVSIFNSIFFQ